MLVSAIRTIIVYVTIIGALRLMGKRQIGQLQTSELVVTLLLSELAILPIQNRRESLLAGMMPMLVLVVFEIATAFIMLKFSKFRKIVCGKPIVVIKEGKLDQKSMWKLRMTTEDLSEQLRQKEAFFLEDVDYAIVETNGMMSVKKKDEEEPLTPKQANISVESKGVEVVAVTDGEISSSSLDLINRKEGWVLEVLRQEKTELKDIFILTADKNGNYKIIPKEKK